MILSRFRQRLPLPVRPLDNVPWELALIGALQKPLFAVERIPHRLIMLAEVAGSARQHEIKILMPPSPPQLAIEMIDMIERRVTEFVGIEAIRAMLLKICQQVRERFL